jgi:hypothetical protein
LRKNLRLVWVLGLLLLVLAACTSAVTPEVISPVYRTLPPVDSPIPLPTPTPFTVDTLDPTITLPAGCLAGEEYAVVHDIADSFQVSYEQIIAWSCDGSEMEDILLALETWEETDIPVEDLLERRRQDQSWDQIWQEIGLLP